MIIKALTLWQPWASLAAIGAKLYETRSWPTAYRGWLAIHAAANSPRWALELAMTPPFNEALNGRTILPKGAIVAVVRLLDCQLMTRDLIARIKAQRPNEIKFGDWAPTRFAWQLDPFYRLRRPIPARGSQRLWDWAPPTWIVEKMEALEST
jgi:hypothetical protein